MGPCWRYLAKNKVVLWGARVFVVAIAFSVGFGRLGAGFWTDFGASGTDFGSILERFGADVGRFVAEF